MPAQKLLQERTGRGSVCAVCGGYCNGTPPLDRPEPLLGDPIEVWDAYRESQVPKDEYVVAVDRVFDKQGSLVYTAGQRIPISEAKKLGVDIPKFEAPSPVDEPPVQIVSTTPAAPATPVVVAHEAAKADKVDPRETAPDARETREQ